MLRRQCSVDAVVATAAAAATEVIRSVEAAVRASLDAVVATVVAALAVEEVVVAISS